MTTYLVSWERTVRYSGHAEFELDDDVAEEDIEDELSALIGMDGDMYEYTDDVDIFIDSVSLVTEDE